MVSGKESPIYLEIYLEDDSDTKEVLERLISSQEFKDLIKSEVYPRVLNALTLQQSEFTLFRMVFYGLDLQLKKVNYKKILEHILELYQQEEDYLECSKIKKIIDKI